MQYNYFPAPDQAKNGAYYIEGDVGQFKVGDTFKWNKEVKARGRVLYTQVGSFTITGIGKTFSRIDDEYPKANRWGEVDMCRYYGDFEETIYKD